MPATPARIGFVTQPYRLATAGPEQRVVDAYGAKARDTVEPIPTFFDDPADAEIMAQERLDLLSAERALVTVRIGDTQAALDLTNTPSLATTRLIDDESDLDRDTLVVGIEVDLGTEQAAVTVWG